MNSLKTSDFYFNYGTTIKEIFAECGDTEKAGGVTLRAGIAPDEDGIMDLSLICDRAKYACDFNRGALVFNFQYFNSSMLADVDKRQYIVDHLDRAINEKWVRVYYQPIVRTANGRVCDEEALARWIDPKYGFLSPGRFYSSSGRTRT